VSEQQNFCRTPLSFNIVVRGERAGRETSNLGGSGNSNVESIEIDINKGHRGTSPNWCCCGCSLGAPLPNRDYSCLLAASTSKKSSCSLVILSGRTYSAFIDERRTPGREYTGRKRGKADDKGPDGLRLRSLLQLLWRTFLACFRLGACVIAFLLKRFKSQKAIVCQLTH
jgi:hypothetical protein